MNLSVWRLLWFAGIYVMSIGTITLVALVVRTVLHLITNSG
jgi:hypothetical protein